MATIDTSVVTVEIRVIRGNNLQRNAADSLESFVQVELDGKVLGVSAPEQTESGEQQIDYDFTCSLQCSKDAQALDDIASKPIILTVTEVLPRDKKKGERMIVLGQAVLDLLPLLHGECSFSSTVPLHPLPSSAAEWSTHSSSSKSLLSGRTERHSESQLLPTLDVLVSVAQPLLTEAELLASNLLRVTLETAYSVPDGWTVPSPHTFSAALLSPLTAEKDQVLLFSNGQLKAGGQKEADGRPRKRPDCALLVPANHFLPGTSIQTEPIELEDGELTSVEEQEIRIEAETMKNRVSWDAERLCILSAGAAARMRQRITENRLWPLEIKRTSNPVTKATKTSKLGVEEEQHHSSHGVAFVDMGPLLYPGVRRIRGAFRVVPFSDTVLLDKAKQGVSVFNILSDQARLQAEGGQVRSTTDLPLNPCKGRAGKNVDGVHKEIKEAVRKHSAQTRTEVTHDEDEDELHASMNSNYEEAGTYITLEITLEKPLVPRRTTEELARRIKELIPPRPPLPQRPTKADKAERAVQGFHGQVANVVDRVLEQFVELFGAGTDAFKNSSPEEMKAELNGALNVSGKYFVFKEQMKHAVVRIVRDKMRRTTPFTEPEELQSFISELYIYLADEMQIAVNKILADDLLESQVQIQLSSSQLKCFAQEARLTGQYEQAAHYYQELVVQEPAECSHWYEWGGLCMQTGDFYKAEECYLNALSIQQTHQPSLIMSAILAEMFKRYEEALTFLERATRIEPPGVVSWMLLGLFHESQNDSFKAVKCFLEASGQQEREGTKGQRGEEQTDKEKRTDQNRKDPCGANEASEAQREPSAHHFRLNSDRIPSIIYRETVEFLLQNNALQMAERALAHELLSSDGGRSISFLLSQAQFELLRADYCSAAATLREALFHHFQDADVWALNGHCQYLQGDIKQAQQSYERSLDFQQRPSDTHLICVRLGSIYLNEKKFEQARAAYLEACQHLSSCATWLGLGIACYRLDKLDEAEDALTEANHLNKHNAEVWGYLSLICLKCGRQAEAEQTYRYAVKLGLQKESLLHEIKELQDQLGYGDPFFNF